MNKQPVKETSIDELIEVIEDIDSLDLSSIKSRDGWLGWLREYDGPGFYKRKPGMNYGARFMYNHNASPSGLLWLIQELGVSQKLVKLAEIDLQRVKRVSKDKHTQSAAIRKRVPWEVVDHALTERILAQEKAYQRKLQRLKKAAS